VSNGIWGFKLNNLRQKELEELYLDYIVAFVRMRDPNGSVLRGFVDSWFAYHSGGAFLSRGGRPIWFNTPDPDKHGSALSAMHFVSSDAKQVLAGRSSERLMKDHAVPIAIVRELLFEIDEVNPTTIKLFLREHYRLGVITKREDNLLSSIGLRSKMPTEWDRSDPFARYKRAEISSSI